MTPPHLEQHRPQSEPAVAVTQGLRGPFHRLQFVSKEKSWAV